MQLGPIITFSPVIDSSDHISPTFKKKTPTNLKSFEQSPKIKIPKYFEQSTKSQPLNPENPLKFPSSSPKSSPKSQKPSKTYLILARKPSITSLKNAGIRKSSQIQIKQQLKQKSPVLEIPKFPLNNVIKTVKKSFKMKPINRFKELLEITDLWAKSEAFYIESKNMAKNVIFFIYKKQ